MQWLEYVAKRNNTFIEHNFNGDKRKIGSCHIFVEANTIFQFMDVIGMVTLLLCKEISCPLNFDSSSVKLKEKIAKENEWRL